MQERHLFEIVEQSSDAAFVVVPGGRIRFWNAAAEALFGYPAVEALDEDCFRLLCGRNDLGSLVCRRDCEIWRCGARGTMVPSFDLEVTLSSGGRRWVNMSNLFYRDRRTSESWVVHFARDISAEKGRAKLVDELLRMLHRLEAQAQPDTAHLEQIAPLSTRQREILRHLAQGKDTVLTAQELGITPQSLRNQLHNINRKLHTHGRLAAVSQAQRRHLI